MLVRNPLLNNDSRHIRLSHGKLVACVLIFKIDTLLLNANQN